MPAPTFMHINYNNRIINFIHGDVTSQEVDAIVNPSNTKLSGGGGVDGAIHRIGGPELTASALRLGGCNVGQSKVTLGFNLPAKFVIHTVGPIYGQHDGMEASYLEDCYKNSLAIADAKLVKTIVFPAISSGVYGYPLWEAAPIALETVKEYLDEHPQSTVQEITFVLFSAEDLDIYKDTAEEVFG